jgi:uncharacterized protein YyaL (SSP411 family)
MDSIFAALVCLLAVALSLVCTASAGGQTRSPLPGEDELAQLPADGGPEFNRLVFEKSPYLQQHARNPVDWYPWGPEAFARAHAEEKPVFLSIGYSTCHWCHVMEHESFEDAEVAKLLNETFVCVKVDREERPDVDDVYMQVTQAMTGSGGIYDHVGFGFHRYSTDAIWLVPHFEKMLYDQALHVMAYTAAWQVTGKAEYRATAEEIVAYVLRDLADERGGFHSAEDADSEGEEGRFYLWTRAEVLAVLGAEEGSLFARVYEITEEGNYHDEASGQRDGRSIPFLARTLASWAAELATSEPQLRARLERAREKLLAARGKRVRPLKDDKVLTDWNGLMIAALARAGAAFDEPRYVAAARAAADFALAELRHGDGRLSKRWRAGEAAFAGTLDDHAFLVWGLIELHQAAFEPRDLAMALELDASMRAHFTDAEHGGFFTTADDAEELLFRHKSVYDGALPSGNSVAAWNLVRLARLTGRTELEEAAERTLTAFGSAARTPMAHTVWLLALDGALGPSFEVVVAGDPAAADTRAMLRAFQERYLPHLVLLLRPEGEAPAIAALAPFTRDQTSRAGRATAYVCRDHACRAPTTDVAQALANLEPESWK